VDFLFDWTVPRTVSKETPENCRSGHRIAIGSAQIGHNVMVFKGNL
jgi:hypothetical protein